MSENEAPNGSPAAETSLASWVPSGGSNDPELVLDRFLGWAQSRGLELYPAQEEALLALMADQHVILSTPTGSGKSLVALGLHFRALCEGRRCYYTTPVKALASEKFFSLCNDLGAQNVGMQTGDTTINPQAPIVCCTAEILSNLALRRGEGVEAPYAVMDEFHYYADPDRGVAWQVPLVVLERTQFLLMSATLGDMRAISDRLRRRTGREVATVYSEDRPVPLEFEYRETPLHETVAFLHAEQRTPAYIVSFTQRECAELAQSLTSMKLTDRDEKRQIRDSIGDFHFDTPYGRDMRRLLNFGIGIHHAGLLPKYRLLVEQLSQRGLLKVICGTDTLGVGVNVPIRTVVFTKLCKYDGTETAILKVRDFKQIAGRAGRKGFDERGWVVCQAPEHEIENRRRQQRAGSDLRRQRKLRHRAPPRDRFVPWTRKTFESLIHRAPETLESRFKMSHSMLLSLLQRDGERDEPEHDNFASLRQLLRDCHEDEQRRRELIAQAAMLVRSLHRAGLVGMHKDSRTDYRWVVVNEDLQFNFSLHQTLALFLVETLQTLDPQDPDYALDALSLTEAVLEDPRAVLYRQADKARDELRARLRARRLSWEERREKLNRVTWPQPNEEALRDAFERFGAAHPWVGDADVHPKSVGREMFESYYGFNDYVRRYGLQRSEGLLLRYLSQLYKTLVQSVPETSKDETLYDAQAYLRTTLEHTDSSLLEEWEAMLHPELRLERRDQAEKIRRLMRDHELLHDPRAFAARVRAEMHQLVRALWRADWDDAVACVRPPDDETEPWSADDFEQALAPFLEEYGAIDFTPRAREANMTQIEQLGPRQWRVSQMLPDPEQQDDWCIRGRIDLGRGKSLESPLFVLEHIGT
jgi:superfamily II RNA helicase